jgi:predicted deacylase
VEAMKMVMPLLTTESGAISHTVSPGSIIEAGELLASLVRWRGANSHASHTYIPPSSCRIPRQSARSASCGCAHSMCAFRPRSDATS